PRGAAGRSPQNRLGPYWLNYIKPLFGLPSQRRLAQSALGIDQIRHWEKEPSRSTDKELREAGLRLRGRARGGESMDKLLPEAFGLVCVAAKRLVEMRPFDVQLAGGAVMHRGVLAELATVECNTLMALLPCFLNGCQDTG